MLCQEVKRVDMDTAIVKPSDETPALGDSVMPVKGRPRNSKPSKAELDHRQHKQGFTM
jgi:hypothetical protein